MSLEETLDTYLYPSNHFQREISLICKPLFDYLGVNYFSFTRVINLHEAFTLTNRPDLARVYWEEAWYMDDPHWLYPDEFDDGDYFWDVHYNSPAVKEGIAYLKDRFNITNGVNLIKKTDEYQQVISYAGPVDGQAICRIYRDKMHLLQEFTDYFLHKAQGIISECRKNHSVTLLALISDRGFNPPD